MTSTIDLSRIPESLRGLKWEKRTDATMFYDGDLFLACVSLAFGECELAVVMAYANEDDCGLLVDGNEWGRTVADIDYFVRI